VLPALGAVWLGGVWPPPFWWREHAPRTTAMMRRSHGRAVAHVPLAEISPVLQRMIIIAEDSRFRTHWGVDPVELRDAIGAPADAGWFATARAAWRGRDRLQRGASTITQQLAKNFYLSPARSPFRKLKEAVTAVRLEWALPKDRILELYVNTVEWGQGVWGVAQASRRYFGVPPHALSEEQAAALAATLPHPRSSNPAFRPGRMLTRRDVILARYRGYDVTIPPVEEIEEIDLAVVPDSIVIPPPPPDSIPPRDSVPQRDSIPVPPNESGPTTGRP
jgi:monofunctional biosynthetic peptidoglycan transglycosylase